MKHNTINLVKFKSLSRRLRLPLCWTVGVLESLWMFAINNARDGDLSQFSPLEIAGWMDFPGDENELIDALVETHWLDRDGDTLTIHDWQDHKPNWLKGIEARSAQNGEYDEPSSEPSSEPRLQPPNLTFPSPTFPNLLKTKSNPSSPNLSAQAEPPLEDGDGGGIVSKNPGGPEESPIGPIALPPRGKPPPDEKQAWAAALLVWGKLVKCYRPQTKRERKVIAQLAYLATHVFDPSVADDAIRAVNSKSPDDRFAYLLGCFKNSVRDLYGAELVDEQKKVHVPDDIINPPKK